MNAKLPKKERSLLKKMRLSPWDITVKREPVVLINPSEQEKETAYQLLRRLMPEEPHRVLCMYLPHIDLYETL